ncbi:uncharacterized protein LOC114538402 isoform X2 [Dendronephthya gigantea]|nr:uncharacterized protein LOC114538402 isoform X2 [Dendronephthya gigantea]XP_028415383.1 uncharacterized protein LOC114538402 isoform X2 [Dendronephthya gigantea]
MMATDSSIKKDGLCSLTAQKLSEEQGFTGRPPARNHPGYSAEEYCQTEPMEPHMIKVPYPDDQNMKRLAHDMKFVQKRGIELKNNELGKVWTNMQHKKAHAEDDKKNMDLDLATKLKERSQKVDEDKEASNLPPTQPEFAQVQLRKTGSRELLNIE